ncbi:MAG: mechanosensitive ion channel [Candidatus Lokiarchaeota archaeon]|nr:mechanosensitive ion channel [Candidatus Lokiarchaeota archaeon]
MLIAFVLYIFNRLLSILFNRLVRIPKARRNKIIFAFRIISIFILIYFIINGFPSFTTLPTEYTAIITGAVSTALAFVSSGVFSNFIAGVLIWIVDPFDIGDVVKIGGYKGVIKSITLSKVVIETMDRIIVEISNSDVASSIVLNYTIKLASRKKYMHFKRQIRSPQDIGTARIDIDVYNEEVRKQEEADLKDFFNLFSEANQDVVDTYNFKMRVPYAHFRIVVDKFNDICAKYGDIFGIRPRFHVIDYSNEITIKFRILTLDSNKILKYQPEFAKELYKAILSKIEL